MLVSHIWVGWSILKGFIKARENGMDQSKHGLGLGVWGAPRFMHHCHPNILMGEVTYSLCPCFRPRCHNVTNMEEGSSQHLYLRVKQSIRFVDLVATMQNLLRMVDITQEGGECTHTDVVLVKQQFAICTG